MDPQWASLSGGQARWMDSGVWGRWPGTGVGRADGWQANDQLMDKTGGRELRISGCVDRKVEQVREGTRAGGCSRVVSFQSWPG